MDDDLVLVYRGQEVSEALTNSLKASETNVTDYSKDGGEYMLVSQLQRYNTRSRAVRVQHGLSHPCCWTLTALIVNG